MLKRSFFSLAKPRLKYPVVALQVAGGVKEVPLPSEGRFFFRQSGPLKDTLGLRIGDRIKTGQRLASAFDDNRFLVSPFTGGVSAISEYTGYLGRAYTSFAITVEKEDIWDSAFSDLVEASDYAGAMRFLAGLPGAGMFESLIYAGSGINTIIVSALEDDFLMGTNHAALERSPDSIQHGINHLKKITSAGRIVLVAPPELGAEAARTNAEIMLVREIYPDTQPVMVLKKVLGKVVSPGRSAAEAGTVFLSAESVAAVGEAFERRRIPVEKMVTVVDKTSTPHLVKVRVGTPVKTILETLQIHTQHGDRLIQGGPMKGQALFADDTPILCDTEGFVLQDKSQIIPASDTHCINCGECVRACPARIPVNMLIRFLENRLYEEAEREWDLSACIECGLCSFVCPARIALFHYIMLGKHELAQMRGEEEAHA